MKYDWSRFGKQPISAQLRKFATKNQEFGNAWKIFNSKYRLLPAFLLFSGDEIDDELIVNFFLDTEAYLNGKERVIHTNVIVNEGFRHKDYTLYTGKPKSLKTLYGWNVKSKSELVSKYPWISDILPLEPISIRELPHNPRIKIALSRVLKSIPFQE